jgi:hypothetical protein
MAVRHDSRESGLGRSLDWDLFDCLAIFGVVALLAGLLLTVLPATRPGGVCVPVGLGLMAFAAYAARRSDKGPTPNK